MVMLNSAISIEMLLASYKAARKLLDSTKLFKGFHRDRGNIDNPTPTLIFHFIQ